MARACIGLGGRILRWIFAFLLILSVSTTSFAEQAPDFDNIVQIEIIQEEETVQPGRPFWIAVRMQLADNWHTYWKNPGDAGMASAIEWELPENYAVAPTAWPTPKRFTVDSMVGFGYEGAPTFLVQILPPPNGSDAALELKATVKWLVCSDSTCIPGETPIAIQLKSASTTPKLNAKAAKIFAEARSQIPNKTQNITAYREQDEIKVPLSLPIGAGTQLLSVDFFPEDQEVIDHTMAAELVASLDAEETHSLILKRHSLKPNSSVLESKVLKGIIVAKDDQGITHSLELNAPIVGSTQIDQPVATDSPLISSELEGGLLMALFLALIGGMILNLMPCVLPVISFKVLSFVKMAGQSRTLIFRHGLAFAGGVLASFWVLAAALLILQAYGESVGWGFQLQEPIFVAILAVVLLMLSLSLFGLFEIGTSMISLAGQVQTKETIGGSFMSGILATAVATPCTGPFLGSAIGFAVTAPAWEALLVFTALGLGMALPYVLLSAFPQLLRFVPRPGPWMNTFKEFMGFFMLASVLWLVWVFGAQTNALAVSFLLGSFVIFALAGWVFGKWGSPVRSKICRMISYAVVLVCVALGGYGIAVSTQPWVIALAGHEAMSGPSRGDWEPFSADRIAELQAAGTPVLVDFTAKWCLICQVNHLVLTQDDVSGKLADLGVVKMKADWTRNDPKITEELRKHGRSGVPLYVLYNGETKDTPQILPQVLTPEIVLQYLDAI